MEYARPALLDAAGPHFRELRLARSLPADPVYRDWITPFACDGYDELVAASTDLLDASCTRRDRVATSDAFDRSTWYEIAFWQMAYTRGGEKSQERRGQGVRCAREPASRATQTDPSGPSAIPCGSDPGWKLISSARQPSRSSRTTELAAHRVAQQPPSGVTATACGRQDRWGSGYSPIRPSGQMRPIWPAPISANHTAPPAAWMPTGAASAVGSG
jgi:hypothetical protein